MDHKLKRNLKYIILAAGFVISAAFYVISGIPEEINIVNESEDYKEKYSEEMNSAAKVEENGIVNETDISSDSDELLEHEKKLIKDYVREVLGEYIEAERLRKEYDREHAEILKIFGKYKTDLSEEINTGNKSVVKININTAGRDELMQLKDIGEKKAEDILNYREEHGVFLAIEELKNIKGIKASLYEKIKDFITV